MRRNANEASPHTAESPRGSASLAAASPGLASGRALGCALVVMLALVVAGCRQDMHDAPRYERVEYEHERYRREHFGRHRWLLLIPLLVVVAWLLDMLIMGQ